MVRGRGARSSLCQGTQSTKKAAGRGNSSPIVASVASGSHKTQKSTASCNGCGMAVHDDTKALQCDRCASPDMWKCATCLHLSGDMYDLLVSDSSVPLRWFCDSCEREVMTRNTGSNQTSGQNDKIEQLISVTEKLMIRYETIEKKIEDKCDVSTATQLDMRISTLEEKMRKYDSELESRLVSIEDQLKMKSDGPATEKMGENAISDEEMIKFVVQEELNRKTEEERDIESRKRNIIIYRVPEKKMENVADRKASDVTFVKDLLDGVFDVKVEEADIEKMYRLGRWTEDKCRPLLVAFKNGELKDHVMANLRNLKQPIPRFKGISVAHDLHPKEREEIKLLVEEAKQNHASNACDDDDVGNYRFIVVGKGSRRKVIKIKKTINAQ